LTGDLEKNVKISLRSNLRKSQVLRPDCIRCSPQWAVSAEAGRNRTQEKVFIFCYIALVMAFLSFGAPFISLQNML